MAVSEAVNVTGLVAGFVTINTALLSLCLYFVKRTLDRLDDIEERVQRHGERLAHIEGERRHTPWPEIRT